MFVAFKRESGETSGRRVEQFIFTLDKWNNSFVHLHIASSMID